MRVEEDWELIVANPDVNSTAPQVTTTLSPTGSSQTLLGAFDLNHRSRPDFQPGGLQVQIWNGDYPVTSQASACECVMSSNGDTVRWTQAMALDSGQLIVEVINGSSTTWGSFGSPGDLRASTATNFSDLNGYTPTFSVENSGVGYAANRVQSITVKRVRRIMATGEVVEDATQRTVFPKT